MHPAPTKHLNKTTRPEKTGLLKLSSKILGADFFQGVSSLLFFLLKEYSLKLVDRNFELCRRSGWLVKHNLMGKPFIVC